MITLNKDPHKGGYVYLPLKSVTGYLPPGKEVIPVVKAIKEAGFADDRIEIFKGEQGAEVLDIEGYRHGMWVRFVRTLEDIFSDTAQIFRRADEVLRNGGTLIIVFPSEDGKDWHTVAEILKHHGAEDITYWGNWAVEKYIAQMAQ